MKEKSVFLGDCFYYSLMLLTIVSLLSVTFTPAKTFLWQELMQSRDYKGRSRAIAAFDAKLVAVGLSREEFSPRILVRKRSRELLVLSDNTLVTSYPVGLGRNPSGIKLDGKDLKTPEGNYHICYKDDQHRYRLFLQINYPSPDDARRGTVQQIILPSEEEKIMKAWEDNVPPPAGTALGGSIGFHGYGSESNWTLDGSVSMHNIHMEELFWNIENGTPVAFVP